MASSKIDMQHEELNWFQNLCIWLNANWKEIGGFALASQLIDRFFKWLTKRSEARIKEIMQGEIQSTVMPDIKKLTNSIDGLKDSMYALNDKILKIK